MTAMDQPITNHELSSFTSDFIEGGYQAECSCGWESDRLPDMSAAALAWEAHSGLGHWMGSGAPGLTESTIEHDEGDG